MKKCPNCGEFLSDDSIQCKHCQKYLDGKVRVDERCECGNLIAKITENTVEIKCRRCKRIHTIQMDMLKEHYLRLLEKMDNQGNKEKDKDNE